MSKFKPSQLVYIVVSNRYIQPVTIQRQDDNKYLYEFLEKYCSKEKEV